MSLDGNTRSWLEEQHAYHTRMLDKYQKNKEKHYSSIKRKAMYIKDLNRDMKKFKKLIKGIEALLHVENWEV